MPRGDKSAYTAEQKRKAEHIEDSYEDRGVSHKEAEARAWATVNKQSGGGEKSGSGKRTSSRAKSASRSDSAKRGAAVAKKGHSPNKGSASRSRRKSPTTRTARQRSASK